MVKVTTDNMPMQILLVGSNNVIGLKPEGCAEDLFGLAKKVMSPVRHASGKSVGV